MYSYICVCVCVCLCVLIFTSKRYQSELGNFKKVFYLGGANYTDV